MQHFFGFDREQIEKIPQLVLAERVLYILDNVELDVAVAQNIQRAVGLASVGVVIDFDAFH
jgi:hypothetical protein